MVRWRYFSFPLGLEAASSGGVAVEAILHGVADDVFVVVLYLKQQEQARRWLVRVLCEQLQQLGEPGGRANNLTACLNNLCLRVMPPGSEGAVFHCSTEQGQVVRVWNT